MPIRPPLPIDPAPLRDVARSLRFAAERGGRSLRKGLPLEVLPEPAVRLADTAVATALRLGEGVSHLAQTLFDDDAAPLPLDHTEAEACTRFAAAAHDGLTAALLRLGAESCLVSEAAVQRAFRHATARAGGSDAATAAALFAALAGEGAVRETVWPDSAAVPAAEAERIAAFAVLLAMLADAPGFRDVLPAAVDIALALRSDLSAAADPEALERLFVEFRDHV